VWNIRVETILVGGKTAAKSGKGVEVMAYGTAFVAK
jgi:hypothetical protein